MGSSRVFKFFGEEITFMSFMSAGNITIVLYPEDIEKLGEEKILWILRWFASHKEELSTIMMWYEGNYNWRFLSQFYSSEEPLRIIANSNLAKEHEREKARNELYYLKHSEKRPKHPPPEKKRSGKILKGYIYLLKGPSNTYKIGRTLDPKPRIEYLGVKLPFPITPVCVIPSDDYCHLEKHLHKRFESKRVNGEWFSLGTEEVNELINMGVRWEEQK